MTKDEMLAMPTGQELDALVAERVMGWWKFVPPRYSTDIAAAFQLVLELQRRNPGWRFSLCGGDACFSTLIYPDGRTDVGTERHLFGWHAELFGHEDPRKCTGQRHGSGRGDTPALAICRAALATTLEI